jgi:hypothetical protein
MYQYPQARTPHPTEVPAAPPCPAAPSRRAARQSSRQTARHRRATRRPSAPPPAFQLGAQPSPPAPRARCQAAGPCRRLQRPRPVHGARRPPRQLHLRPGNQSSMGPSACDVAPPAPLGVRTTGRWRLWHGKQKQADEGHADHSLGNVLPGVPSTTLSASRGGQVGRPHARACVGRAPRQAIPSPPAPGEWLADESPSSSSGASASEPLSFVPAPLGETPACRHGLLPARSSDAARPGPAQPS